MNEFQFEIFLRGFDRYSWRLVQRGGDRRVIARAPVDFATPLLAENSIMVMKDIVANAEIVRVGDGYGEVVGFEIVDAFPLRLRNTVSDHETAAATDGPAAATDGPAAALRPAPETASKADNTPAQKVAQKTAQKTPVKAATAKDSRPAADGATVHKAPAARSRRS